MSLRVRRCLTRLLVLLFVLDPTVGRAGHIHILNFEISGGALIIPGLLTVSYGDAEIRKLGWLLVLVGTMVSTGSLRSRPSEELSAREVWGGLVRESRVYARHPELITEDTELAAAARVMRLRPRQLARLVLDLNREDAEVVRARYIGPDFVDAEQRRGFNVMAKLARAS